MMRNIVLLISAVTLVQCMQIPQIAPPAPLAEEDREAGAALDENDFLLAAEMTDGSEAPQGISIESANENADHSSQRSANGLLFEGDIMLTPQQREIVDRGIQSEMDEMRSSVTNERRKWPARANGQVVIPYTLDSKFDTRERGLIASGIDQFHDRTCIQFVHRTSQVDYLNIFKGKDGQCWSLLGKAGGKQPLSLGKGCPGRGVVTHEIMHTLGWWHEQSRADRDNYIKVHWDNIETKMHSQFTKCNGCSDQGSPYDTTSVMQYGTWAFQKTKGKPSMTKIGCPDDEVNPADQSCKLGQYNGMNESDLFEINKLYCGGRTFGGCKNNPDVAHNCQNYFNYGFCEHSYVSWMKKNCPLTCGFCSK